LALHGAFALGALTLACVSLMGLPRAVREPNIRLRVFRYGLLAPTFGDDDVSAQIVAAHRYHERLVEIERARRDAEAEVLRARGSLEEFDSAVNALAARLEQLRARIRARSTAARNEPDATEERAAATACRRELALARAAARVARLALRKDAGVQVEFGRIRTSVREQVRAARAACGVYWGTYLRVEQAVDAARRSPGAPRLRRWQGEGSVAAQLQQGLSLERALACTDRRLQLDLRPQPVPGRDGRSVGRVRLRIGSENRRPVWAEWPLIYHRPLPSDGRLKWAQVVRRVVAARTIWSLHLTVESPALEAPLLPGAVAVDLGWRRQGGHLRAGGWADDRGDSGDILVDPAVTGMLQKAGQIRGIRDGLLAEVRRWLVEWCAGPQLHPEHAARMAFVEQWRAPSRFAAHGIWWRENRFQGDVEAFDRLERWRRRDKHLWQWEANARRRAILHRREQFRVLARRLAGRYGTLVVEQLDLRQIARIPPPESPSAGNARARAQRFEAAPGELRACLVQAFAGTDRRVVTVPALPSAAEMLRAYRERPR
jgi:hypothetical protein